MQKYDPKKIEKKWQKYWDKNKTFEVKEDSAKTKFYGLVEFPYPSGAGLHVGHPRSYTAMDIIARKKRMEGFNVLYPMGFDAFGLPTENYAIKTGRPPAEVTAENIATFTKQLKSLGFSFDWSRVVDTTDPKYYKWTQWIFLQFFKHGLAYKKNQPINWCPKDKIGLANEEVVNGCCERCGTPVEQRNKEQWMLAITKYADKLLEGLKEVDYIPQARTQQENWIGRSEGAVVRFVIARSDEGVTKQSPSQSASSASSISSENQGIATPRSSEARNDTVEVFTTRPDTIFGATFIAVSPELAKKWLDVGWQASSEVKKYISQELEERKKKTNREEEPEKTGISAGITAVNPVNNEEIPVWITNYVMGNVGTGAIMGVPAHDQRDNDFAKKFGLKIKAVILASKHVSGLKFDGKGVAHGSIDDLNASYNDNYSVEEMQKIVEEEGAEELENGLMCDSDFLNGLIASKAKEKIIQWLEEKGIGKRQVNYKLRDWVFSRQRYWGEPIPLVFCEHCGGWIPLPESELPLKLPKVKKYEPTDTGESPLSTIEKWVKTKCPQCGGPARRETDTMPNWAGSSWYFLRYADPDNDKAFASEEKLKYWMPVDWYNGGMEHTVLHLLYSRFWNEFLYDIGVVPTREPYKKRTSHGIILASDGEKMSKSRGNVVNPDEIVEQFGADTLRTYIMFMGPFDQAVAWDTNGLVGVKRFLDKVWNQYENFLSNGRGHALDFDYHSKHRIHITIKKISEDIDKMAFNTAVAAMMEYMNELSRGEVILDLEAAHAFLKLLNPFAPHISSELYALLQAKFGGSTQEDITQGHWPTWQKEFIVAAGVTIAVQINGKVRDQILIMGEPTEEDVKERVFASEKVQKWLEGKEPKKVIYVKGKLVSIVV